MPELPEVECVRRGLARARLGGAKVSCRWRSEHLLRTGAFWRDERLDLLEGATTGAFERRGKFLVWRFDGADGVPLGLVIHLGMTGRVTVTEPGADRVPHTHLVFELDNGRALHFSDPRRFGGVHADPLDRLRTVGPLAELGPEPLDPGFDGTVLEEQVRGSTRALRDVLLDQRVVAGLGNIYVSEALFVAGLHPLTRANGIRPSAWQRLAEAIVTVLRQGLDNGGTTLRDYRGASGERGSNQNALLVYGRAELPCPSCGSALTGYTHGGRSGVFCRQCQPKRRRR
ncbi:MAG: bifunctional DNA-formamidopyrimidine glycosylase/DNA-(apurinic or apyrimidinic site) lyase [Myxococcota bacterium]